MQSFYGRRITMSFAKKEFCAPSCDGIHTLKGVIYEPDTAPIGFFQIAHGMTEHIGRYERIMSDLCERGFICFGYDHLGHGNTARDKSELGYIAKKSGWDLLCRDIKAFSDAVFAEYSEKYGKLPYFLMGHSMGSFIVRLAAEKYVNPDKLIVMGTGGANLAAPAGIALISLIKLFKGDRHISKLIDKMAFGSYNNKFKGDANASSKSWLTTDQSIRNKYLEDNYCTFKFTVSAMGDLMTLLKNSNRGAWFKEMGKKQFPILLVAGEDDPVGNYGAGVRQVEEKLKARGADVDCILYKGGRHEILNDVTYESVRDDIVKFCIK